MKTNIRKKIFVITILLVGLFVLYFQVLTPRIWRWGYRNLQVTIHSVDYIVPTSDIPRWGNLSFGWSKSDLFVTGWLGSTATEGDNVTTKMKIVGVRPSGVSVNILRNDSHGYNFDKTIFVTADAPIRVDISDELYITAHFEPNDT
jgi:hypothetical protein